AHNGWYGEDARVTAVHQSRLEIAHHHVGQFTHGVVDHLVSLNLRLGNAKQPRRHAAGEPRRGIDIDHAGHLANKPDAACDVGSIAQNPFVEWNAPSFEAEHGL